eukprot:TRINITY_DN23301_c0_g1_i4.p8 TRINITY_DN23301_c0_g1~~TRINITY_DN23301_c0_g1_i4.p8  ORF type:complete len:114 (-),score=9.27 TRINITY_DN23301_c0_g1_i4:44-385(-)
MPSDVVFISNFMKQQFQYSGILTLFLQLEMMWQYYERAFAYKLLRIMMFSLEYDFVILLMWEGVSLLVMERSRNLMMNLWSTLNSEIRNYWKVVIELFQQLFSEFDFESQQQA